MDCPSCHNDVAVIEANYGALFTCPSCQSVYFINFDGQAEFDNSPGATQINDGSKVTIQAANGGTTIGLNTAIANAQDVPTDFSLTQVYHNNEETLIRPPAPTALESAMSDIENFGNQNIEVNLTFNLKVIGLDSKDTVNLFFEAINDSKFGWTADDIMKNLNQGQCEIKNIKPVSAHILAKRLQFVDVTLDWSFQNAI